MDTPEIVVPRTPHFVAISKEVRHETRSEISGKVDSVACLPTPACADTKDDKEETERCEVA